MAGQVWAAVQQLGHRVRPRPARCRGGPGRVAIFLPTITQAVHELTMSYLDEITSEELDRIVDTRWNPPVTASVRLVSVIGDTLQHLGQAAYVRGLASRRDRPWHEPSSADR